ncbi:hypothetical protein [Chromobacterium alticapitis]|uniref:Uncharacterized protein n=1 Tax=Chromobacterium alticapitis TaxID=2073169 RepID=A0A2S5DG46_9NEIS|nr:hypothetical protein [Chromobacterium alticapitis]POZ61962.1 hypothetical protein C2I19_11285 [Chromobacterium alticapitis]
MAFQNGKIWIKRLLGAAALLAACHALAQAAPPEPPHSLTRAAASPRPAGVPADYLITPFGYFHPACVQEIRPRESVQADGSIRGANGAVRAGASCQHVRYTLRGEAIGPRDKRPAPQTALTATQSAINGWVLDTELTTSSAYGGINASWTVPANPAAYAGQVVYFFPGLQDYNDVQSILQPVLGWNAFNDNRWTIASWNCCQNGAVNYSSPQAVASGDQIVGTVQNNCAAGAATCSSWNINTQDLTRNVSSALNRTSNYGQTFNWAFGGVLEVYGVSSCGHYPSDGGMSFAGIQLFDANKRQITQGLSWQANVLQQAGCNLNASAAPGVANLSY